MITTEAKRLKDILNFLNNIGIKIIETELEDETFLPG